MSSFNTATSATGRGSGGSFSPNAATGFSPITQEVCSVDPARCVPLPQNHIQAAEALFAVPEGFQALLKHITVELINARPKDPYVYVSRYLRAKLQERKRGVLEQDFFEDDTLNIEVKPPMHYLNQSQVQTVPCPSSTAFEKLESEGQERLSATTQGIQDREEVLELRRDPERKSFRASVHSVHSGQAAHTAHRPPSSISPDMLSGGGPGCPVERVDCSKCPSHQSSY